MEIMTQLEIFQLIGEINSFADRAETSINNTRASYEQNKKSMSSRHNASLNQLESSYKRNCNAITSRSNQTIADARKILSDVESLDLKLTQVDKYYVKTKKKKQTELAETISNQFDEATDYFSVLDEIKAQYSIISKKYSEDILPALINGLNYLFSSKRKKDYEELIVLLNTIRAFVKEIETELPAIANEELAALKDTYFSNRKNLLNSNQAEKDRYENQYRGTLDALSNCIWDELDSLLPDDFVEAMAQQISDYNENFFKVNNSVSILNKTL